MLLLASIRPIEGKQRPQISLPKLFFFVCFKGALRLIIICVFPPSNLLLSWVPIKQCLL